MKVRKSLSASLVDTMKKQFFFSNELISRGVMVIVVANGHGDRSSNPVWDCLHFP